MPAPSGSPSADDPKPDAGGGRWIRAAVLLLTPVATFCYHQVQTDDPYITFRYARNLVDGTGLTFNAGEPVLGTTAPLFAMILAACGWATDDFPLLTSLINGIALAALALLVHRLLCLVREPVAGGIAALLVVANPLMGDAFGMELNLFLAFCFGAYFAYFGGWLKLASLLLVLATMTRGDGFVPALLILIHYLWTRRKLPHVPILIFALLVGGWSLFAWAEYGSPFPNTLAAKRAMGESGLWRPLWYGALRMPFLYLKQTPLFAWLGLLAFIGLQPFARGDRRLWLLFGWPAIVFAAYTTMGIPSAANYIAALGPFLAIVVALGAVRFRDAAVRRFAGVKRQPGLLLTLVVIPLLVAQIIPVIDRVKTHPEARYWTYRKAGEWMNANTPPGASVGLVEIGIVGYYSNRRIVDVCGLVDPGVGPHLAKGEVDWPIRTQRPNYVLVHDPPWPHLEGAMVAADWFGQEYEQVRRFAGEEPYRLTLYARRL